MPPALRVQSLWKCYTAGVRGCSARVWALRGVSFTVEPGECVAIVGGPGSGKTTLARCIQGSRIPNAGLIEVTAALHVVDLDERGVVSDRQLESVAPSYPLSDKPRSTLLLSRDEHAFHPPPDRLLLLRDGRVHESATRHARRVAEGSGPDALWLDLLR